MGERGIRERELLTTKSLPKGTSAGRAVHGTRTSMRATSSSIASNRSRTVR
jgi:hypothetical protein